MTLDLPGSNRPSHEAAKPELIPVDDYSHCYKCKAVLIEGDLAEDKGDHWICEPCASWRAGKHPS